jgi:hypothetical protein
MKRSNGMSRTEWMAGSLAAVVLGLTLSAAVGDTSPLMVKKTKAIANCRQIVLALKLYASDHGGNYPSPDGLVSSSNQAFRRLFREEVLEAEGIFGCPDSVFMPDNQIGQAPDYNEALKPGENHWAMTDGLFDSSSGGIPLVYENPVKAEWPPKWKPGLEGKREKGEAWPGGAVLVGMNDGGASFMKLRDGTAGAASVLENPSTSEEVFSLQQQFTVLDVEPAKAKQ